MSNQAIRGTSSVNSGTVNRRDVLLASTGAGLSRRRWVRTALMQITQAHAQTAREGLRPRSPKKRRMPPG